MSDQAANQLYFGDNLNILREHIPDDSVDLIYLDPPFNSNADYNVLFRERSGTDSVAQITAFEDTWRWDLGSALAYEEAVTSGSRDVARLLASLHSFLGPSNMMAYLTMMTPRIVELHRVLKPTGSIYLHCDTTASHYLRLIMDTCFGMRNFRNEISWKRTAAHNNAKRWGRNRDALLFYSASGDYTWHGDSQAITQDYVNPHYREEDELGRFRWSDLTVQGIGAGHTGQPWRDVDPAASAQPRHWSVPRYTWHLAYPEIEPELLTTQEQLDLLDEAGMVNWPPGGSFPQVKDYLSSDPGHPMQEQISDIPPIGSRAAERLGYPTQKPVKLLDRIIQASSNEGDVVLDPFCGCGTALVSAEALNRRWIGIDVTHLAVALIKHRLADTFGSELEDYTVHGVPEDVASAEALAAEDRHKFEWWAVSLVDAHPANNKKKGPDGGVDGIIHFFDDNRRNPKRIIVQVKSGKVQRSDIATLNNDRQRENAEIALFVTLKPPTSRMTQEALAPGFYQPSKFPGQRHPRIQILTIDDLLSGVEPSYPRGGSATFRKAKRRRKPKGSQGSLGD